MAKCLAESQMERESMSSPVLSIATTTEGLRRAQKKKKKLSHDLIQDNIDSRWRWAGGLRRWGGSVFHLETQTEKLAFCLFSPTTNKLQEYYRNF